jgi:hypothetical protein
MCLGLAACGGDSESQAESEPSGKFPAEVVTSKFPNRQRLAETTDLELVVENTGQEVIPNLAVTIWTASGEDDDGADGSFSIRVDNPTLANPNRPVWILDNKYPRIEGDPAPKGSSPGTVAQTNTFGFGELDPGQRRGMIWKLTPVEAGTYTVRYEVAAGLYGNAKAVAADGTRPEGEFVVTITDKPPKARVTNSGQVEVASE